MWPLLLCSPYHHCRDLGQIFNINCSKIWLLPVVIPFAYCEGNKHKYFNQTFKCKREKTTVWKVAGNFSGICCSLNVLLWLNVQKRSERIIFATKNIS